MLPLTMFGQDEDSYKKRISVEYLNNIGIFKLDSIIGDTLIYHNGMCEKVIKNDNYNYDYIYIPTNNELRADTMRNKFDEYIYNNFEKTLDVYQFICEYPKYGIINYHYEREYYHDNFNLYQKYIYNGKNFKLIEQGIIEDYLVKEFDRYFMNKFPELMSFWWDKYEKECERDSVLEYEYMIEYWNGMRFDTIYTKELVWKPESYITQKKVYKPKNPTPEGFIEWLNNL
jgi:hypothetical protein